MKLFHHIPGFTGSAGIARAVALLLMLCLPLVSCTKGGGNSAGAPGKIAPDFTAKDLSGREVRLSSLAGQVVLLEFFATWCPPCRDSIPSLVSLQNKYQGKGLTILAVSVDEGDNLHSMLADFSKDNGINYTVLLGNEALSNAYQVSGIPVTFLIDKTGKISSMHMGAVEDNGEAISGRIEKLL